LSRILFGDRALAQRLEFHDALSAVEHAETQARLYPESQPAVQPVAGGYAVFTGRGSPANHAAGLGMAAPVTPANLDQVEEFYRSRGLPSSVNLCPLAHSSLVELLGQRCYQIGNFQNVFIRPLDPADAARPLSSEVEVTVAGLAEAERWAKVAFAPADKDTEFDWPRFMLIRAFHKPHATLFVARLSGQLAGGGVVERRDGLASLYAAYTLPAFRGQGVQTALLHARLAAAAAAGCDLATVHTTPGTPSQRNVQRAGFQLVYTRFSLSAGKAFGC